MDYAAHHPNAEWAKQLTLILRTDPPMVSEPQITKLFNAIRSELWPANSQPSPLQSDPMMDIVVFCKGDPVIIGIMGDLALHMKDELSWAELGQIIAGVSAH